MGALQSSQSCRQDKLRRHASIHGGHSSAGNLLVTFSSGVVSLVNADTSELSLCSLVIEKHCRVVDKGWDNLTYSYSLSPMEHTSMVNMMAAILLALFNFGLEPLTSIDTGQKRKKKTMKGPHTMVCFKKRNGFNRKNSFGSNLSVYSRSKSVENSGQGWLGLEISHRNQIQLHDMPNSVLQSLVTASQSDGMVQGVSMGVASVIKDYTAHMPNIIQEQADHFNDKVIHFHQNISKLPECIARCLKEEGYSQRMVIWMDENIRILFYIKTLESL